MTLVQDDLAGVDVASPSVYAEGVPHETLAALREHDPVHWHPFGGRAVGSGSSARTRTSSPWERIRRRSRRNSVTSRWRTGSPTRSRRGRR